MGQYGSKERKNGEKVKFHLQRLLILQTIPCNAAQTCNFRRKLTGQNHSILMGVPSSSLSWRLSSHLGLKCDKRECRNLGNFFSMEHSWWASHFARKKVVFLARMRHAGAFPGICVFLLSQPSHSSAEKRHFFDRKKGKSDFHSNPLSSNCSQLSKTWEEAHKNVRHFSENVGEKKKNVGHFLRKLQRFLGPFRWRLWKQKVQNPRDARACERGIDEKRKLYAVIATNNESFVRQICRRWKSTDLPTHAPQHKWRKNHRLMPCELASALARSQKEPQKTTYLASAHSRTRYTITFYVTFSAIFLSLLSYPPIYY